MDGLESALVIVMCINLMLVLGQFSAMKVNPDFVDNVVDCANSPLGQFGSCNGSHYTADMSNPTLPTSSTSVDATTGTVFTDLYNTVKGFFADTLGLKYVTAIFGAPASFLKGMNLDPDFANLIGKVWWAISLVLFITYLKR